MYHQIIVNLKNRHVVSVTETESLAFVATTEGDKRILRYSPEGVETAFTTYNCALYVLKWVDSIHRIYTRGIATRLESWGNPLKSEYWMTRLKEELETSPYIKGDGLYYIPYEDTDSYVGIGSVYKMEDVNMPAEPLQAKWCRKRDGVIQEISLRNGKVAIARDGKFIVKRNAGSQLPLQQTQNSLSAQPDGTYAFYVVPDGKGWLEVHLLAIKTKHAKQLAWTE